MDQVPHDEAQETTTIAHGKRAIDGTTAALSLQIERQETTRISFAVVGARVTMAHSETAIHVAIIPTKTATTTMDGEMTMRKVTTIKANVTTIHPRIQSQEKKQIPAVIGGRITAAYGRTARDGASIPTKAVTATMDGGMTIRRVTRRKKKGTVMRPRSKSQEADQAPTAIGDKMTTRNGGITAATDLGPTPGNMQKTAMAVEVQPQFKMAMCTGTRRRRRRRRSAGRLN